MKRKILPLLSLGLPVLTLSACSDELKATLSDAGMNTLVGMGVVFVILILISLVISAFSLINKAQDKAAKRKAEQLHTNAPPAPELPEEEIPEEEELEPGDDLELVAVIAAAIAASENTDPSGIVVRSIRKVSSANHWKRG